MKDKPVVLRSRADEDIRDAVEYYRGEGGPDVAERFVDALEVAFGHIARHPATGSLRYAVELEISGIRCWPVKRFPYLLFYVDRDDHIDVWRVLHARQDIPAWLSFDAGAVDE